MEKEFIQYINKHKLFEKPDKILLAISGGIDSVTMLHLFVQADYNVTIAHCNFKLRGSESDGDAIFVEQLAEDNGIPFISKEFETSLYAEENSISIQMAARELRYNWFNELRRKEHFKYIAVAHNKNDLAETFLINFSRGTGIRGYTSLRPKNYHIVRPLLFATREMIFTYLKQKQLRFREDSSNASDKYIRNKIRHQIIPEFETINPDFINTCSENIERLAEVEEIFLKAIDKAKNEATFWKGDEFHIIIEKLEQLGSIKTLLYEFLHPFNYTGQQISDIAESIHGETGKRFYSSTHRLVKDREYLILSEIEQINTIKYYLENNTDTISEPVKLAIKILENTDGFKIQPDPEIACIDCDLLTFPLIIRKWQKGDYFKPLGMNDFKKLSDYLIDAKISIPEKEKLWIVTSEGKIVWIIGKRIDDRFKITSQTRKVMILKLSGTDMG